jgi:hypothetical protein
VDESGLSVGSAAGLLSRPRHGFGSCRGHEFFSVPRIRMVPEILDLLALRLATISTVRRAPVQELNFFAWRASLA